MEVFVWPVKTALIILLVALLINVTVTYGPKIVVRLRKLSRK